MGEQEQVEQIFIAWKMALDDGEDDGEPVPSRRAALLAVRAMNRPREWVAGDTIPDNVHVVATETGVTFRRGQQHDGSPLWALQSSSIPEARLLAALGPVHEVPSDTPPAVTGLDLIRTYRSDGEDTSQRTESEWEALTDAYAALARAVDVLGYISVKLGVNDAKRCQSAAAKCSRALTGLTGLVGLTESERD